MLATGGNGQTSWKAVSEAFGAAGILQDQSRIEMNLRLPGQYFDQETGTHYNFHRDYQPTTGRYLQSDPIRLAGGINLFAYGKSSPIRFVDPYGRIVIAPIIFWGVPIAAGAIWAATNPGARGAIGRGWRDLVTWARGHPKPGNESRPVDAPTGTLPIDQTGLGRGDIHDIKDGIGAGPADWTGITPDGEVITSDEDGAAINHGPADQFTDRPTGLCNGD